MNTILCKHPLPKSLDTTTKHAWPYLNIWYVISCFSQ